MQIDRPDPRYLASKRSRNNFNLAVLMALALCGLVWAVFLADQLLGLELSQWGLRPRTVSGLTGVLFAPLLHSGLPHLFHNTLPLLVGLTAMLYLYPNAALRALPLIWVGGGLVAWLIGRPSIHIGASGVIYGILAFVFVSGILRRDLRSVGVSLLVWFLYGSMVWGLLPIREGMSWEMHAGGAICGVVLAIVFRHWDRVPVQRYQWEEEDEVPEWYLRAEQELAERQQGRQPRDVADAGPESRPRQLPRQDGEAGRQ